MKSNKLDLAMNILKFGLVIIGVILCILVINGPNAEDPVLEQEAFREGGRLGAAISYTMIVMFACVGLVLLFFVMQLITNPKKTIMSIIGIVAALALYLVLSLFGSTDTWETLALRDPVSDSTIASTTAGIYTVVIGLVVAIVMIFLGPLMGKLRK